MSPEPPAHLQTISLDEGGFFGRAAELARLTELLALEGALVTLVGPPGVGKTRLASEQIKRWYPADTLLVDLSEAQTPEAMLSRMAEALQLSFTGRGREQLAEQLGEALAEREGLLLVLDNLEQLVETATTALLALRHGAPAVRWLVTSREPLGLHGEWRVDLAPLSTEGTHDGDSEAVHMLLDRVTRARGAPPPAGERAMLPRIAVRLDGLPLALELAASRIAAVGAAAVEARLEPQLAVLTRGPRDLDRRQRTLREAIAWSWQLLTAAEQRALAHLSVLRGGFDLGAAEAVIGGERDALDQVAMLRQKSLLYTRVDEEGGVRFGLYLSIREFAAGELAPADRAAAEQRHAHHFVAFVERMEDPAQLLLERDNLLVAIERCLDDGAPAAIELGGRLLVGFAALVDRTPIAPYLEQLERLLAMPSATALSPRLRCLVQATTARCLRRMSRPDARRLYAEALELARAIDDRPLQAHLHSELGMVAFFENVSAEALAQWSASTALFRELGEERRLAVNQTRQGMILRECGRLLEAREVQTAALERHRRRNDHAEVAISLTELAQIHTELDELEDSALRLEEAERSARGGRTLLTEAALCGRHAILAFARDDLELAQMLAQRTLAYIGQAGYRRFEAGLMAYCGIARLAAGERAAAWDNLSVGLRLFGADPRGAHMCGAWLAFLELREGRIDEAAQRFAALPTLAADDPFAVAAALLKVPLDGGTPEELEAEADRRGAVVLSGTGLAAAASSFDVRLARRAVGVLCAQRPSDEPRPRARRATGERADATALCIAADAGRFTLRAEARSLARHRTLRRLLRKLVEARLATPGAAIGWEAMFAAGWPNERANAEAAKNRVKVAVSSLRGLGLRDVLLHDGLGYLLDPSLPVRVVASA